MLSAHDGIFNAEGISAKAAHRFHISVCGGNSYSCGTYSLAAVIKLFDKSALHSEFFTKALHILRVAGGVLAEAKIRSADHFFALKMLNKHLSYKFFARKGANLSKIRRVNMGNAAFFHYIEFYTGRFKANRTFFCS